MPEQVSSKNGNNLQLLLARSANFIKLTFMVVKIFSARLFCALSSVAPRQLPLCPPPQLRAPLNMYTEVITVKTPRYRPIVVAVQDLSEEVFAAVELRHELFGIATVAHEYRVEQLRVVRLFDCIVIIVTPPTVPSRHLPAPAAREVRRPSHLQPCSVILVIMRVSSMQSAILLYQFRPSVRLILCPIPVLCQNGSY